MSDDVLRDGGAYAGDERIAEADRPSKERVYVSYRSQEALYRFVAFVNSP